MTSRQFYNIYIYIYYFCPYPRLYLRVSIIIYDWKTVEATLYSKTCNVPLHVISSSK